MKKLSLITSLLLSYSAFASWGTSNYYVCKDDQLKGDLCEIRKVNGKNKLRLKRIYDDDETLQKLSSCELCSEEQANREKAIVRGYAQSVLKKGTLYNSNTSNSASAANALSNEIYQNSLKAEEITEKMQQSVKDNKKAENKALKKLGRVTATKLTQQLLDQNGKLSDRINKAEKADTALLKRGIEPKYLKMVIGAQDPDDITGRQKKKLNAVNTAYADKVKNGETQDFIKQQRSAAAEKIRLEQLNAQSKLSLINMKQRVKKFNASYDEKEKAALKKEVSKACPGEDDIAKCLKDNPGILEKANKTAEANITARDILKNQLEDFEESINDNDNLLDVIAQDLSDFDDDGKFDAKMKILADKLQKSVFGHSVKELALQVTCNVRAKTLDCNDAQNLSKEVSTLSKNAKRVIATQNKENDKSSKTADK